MEALILEVKNGKWSINNKPISICSEQKKAIFVNHFRMKRYKAKFHIPEFGTLKNRSAEVKENFNYKFQQR